MPCRAAASRSIWLKPALRAISACRRGQPSITPASTSSLTKTETADSRRQGRRECVQTSRNRSVRGRIVRSPRRANAGHRFGAKYGCLHGRPFLRPCAGRCDHRCDQQGAPALLCRRICKTRPRAISARGQSIPIKTGRSERHCPGRPVDRRRTHREPSTCTAARALRHLVIHSVSLASARLLGAPER